MVKLKIVKNTGEERVPRNALTKVQGKIKKSKQKPSSVIRSKQFISDVQNIKTKSNKPGKSEVEGKLKRFKKKFGATLFPESMPRIQPTGNNVIEETDQNNSLKRPLKVKAGHVAERRNKRKKRRKELQVKDIAEEKTEEAVPLARYSDDPIPKKVHWINRQRVLVFCCRGISTRDRHLMKDLQRMLPHSRPENKMERTRNLSVVNEICVMKNCNKCMLFEGRANRDVYMWLSNVADGPSAKFLLQNIYTMDELKFTGNCLLGSRPLLSFDENFENLPHYRLIKELLTQIFGVPNQHPKSQPFFDHVLTFSVADNRIWFRNFQILAEDGALVEIGPRFIMNPVKIFDGSFGGETIWENPHYVTPAKVRQVLKKAAGGKYVNRVNQKIRQEKTQGQVSYKLPITDEVFTADTWGTAKELVSKNTDVGGSTTRKQKKKGRKSKQKRPSLQSRSVQAVE